MRYVLAILAFALCLLAACKPPAPPAPTTQPAKPLVLIVPGLGDGQLDDVTKRIREAFGDAVSIADFSTGRDAYLSDVASYANSNPHGKLIVIGHSYGCSKLSAAMPNMGHVKLAIFLDPVREVGDPPLAIPVDTDRGVIVTGDFSGLVRASVDGVYDEYKIHKGHSAMAHDPGTLGIMEREIRGAL